MKLNWNKAWVVAMLCVAMWAQNACAQDKAVRVRGELIDQAGGDPVLYPAEALAAHIEGVVVLDVAITKTGELTKAVVVSGPDMLRKATLDTVQTWHFRPYKEENGEPVDVHTTVTVLFTLSDMPPKGNDWLGGIYIAQLPTPPETYRVKLGGEVTPPVVIHQVSPKFPESARKHKFAGNVLVRVIVDKNGEPTNVRAYRTIGLGLEGAAVTAVKQYKFKPAMSQGQPVAVMLNIEVNFQIY